MSQQSGGPYLKETQPDENRKHVPGNGVRLLLFVKAGPLRLKQLTNTLKIRILSETSILYLIRYASIILTVGLRL